MKKEGPPAQGTPYVENLLAPEVFVIGAAGFLLSHGNVHITFASPKATYGATKGVANVENLRLIIPVASAEDFANTLLDYINKQLDRQVQLPPPSGAKH